MINLDGEEFQQFTSQISSFSSQDFYCWFSMTIIGLLWSWLVWDLLFIPLEKEQFMFSVSNLSHSTYEYSKLMPLKNSCRIYKWCWTLLALHCIMGNMGLGSRISLSNSLGHWSLVLIPHLHDIAKFIYHSFLLAFPGITQNFVNSRKIGKSEENCIAN